MKIRTIVAATSAALFSLGAIAAGDKQQSQSQSGQGRSAPSSSAASGSTSQQQAGGQKSDLVKQAQQKLSAQGHEVGPADGIMGPKTQEGLKEFQQSKGLEATGELNRETLSALGVSGDLGSSSAATGGSTSGQPSGASGSSSASSPSVPAASGSSSGSSSGQSGQKKQ